MKVISVAVAVVALCTLSQSGLASWQYTKWGMTVSQVRTASKGAARAPSAEDAASHSASDGSSTVELSAPYTTGTYNFTAYFSFNRAGKLDAVQLILNEGNPHEVVGALQRKYGRSSNDGRGLLNAWRWMAGTDSLAATLIGENLTLTYSPQHDVSEKGL